MAHTTETRPPTGSTDTVQLALRVAAVAALVVLLWQFVTAGSVVATQGSSGLNGHAVGAIVLHVVTGILVLAAAAGWRLRGHPVWPTVLAAFLFICTFIQAYAGSHGAIMIHVPGAMILTVGLMVLAVWSPRRAVSS